MQKQTVTYKRIKKDLVERLIYDEFVNAFLSMLTYSGIIIVLFLACRLMLNLDLKVPTVGIVIIIAIDVILMSSALVNVLKLLTKIKNNTISVLNAKLTDRVEGGYHRRGLPGRGPYVYYELCFYPYNNYIIPARKHYKWTRGYCMSEEELYTSSNIGEDFIIVTHNQKDILLVYNKKFFEYEKL